MFTCVNRIGMVLFIDEDTGINTRIPNHERTRQEETKKNG